MTKLVTQDTVTPTRKVMAGLTIGTPISVVVVYMIQTQFGLELPTEIQLAAQAIVQGLIQGLITFGVQYAMKERA